MWLVSTNFAWLILVQLVGGALWAAYELAMFLLFFEAIADDERTSMLTTYNLAQAIATVGGSLVGGLILLSWGSAPATYLAIFALSSIARGCTLVFLRGAGDVRVGSFQVATRTVALRPDGSMDRPIIASLPVAKPTRRGWAALVATAVQKLKRFRVDGPQPALRGALSNRLKHRDTGGEAVEVVLSGDRTNLALGEEASQRDLA
jgi:MFS family permease